MRISKADVLARFAILNQTLDDELNLEIWDRPRKYKITSKFGHKDLSASMTTREMYLAINAILDVMEHDVHMRITKGDL